MSAATANSVLILLLKAFLIFAVLVLFLFVLDQLMRERTSIKEGATTQSYTDDSPAVTEAKSLIIPAKQYPAGTSSCAVTDLRLMDYCIKGSANSAFSGNYASMEMMEYVLSRGVRFIDLQVFWIDEREDAYVGYTPDKLSYTPNGCKNANLPPLSMILSKVLSKSFVQQQGSNYVVTNPLDPLFIQIRMQTDAATMPALYARIQSILSNLLKDSKYSYGNTQVSRFTPLSQVQQKMLVGFVSDEYYIVRPAGNNPADYVNFLTNSESLQRLTYNEVSPAYNIKINPPKTLTQYTTDVTSYLLVDPDRDNGELPNPNPFHAIQLYGTQIILYKYYLPGDMNLLNAEVMYSSRNGGIVPMSLILAYINITAEPSETDITGGH
jgi:hypothetical protein